MKIIQLKSENIKKLKAVQLTFDEKENVVVISGKNGQGKTSILDSIWYALGGKEGIPDEPIRKGEKRAEVSLNLGKYIVKRVFTEKGTTLSVENASGAMFKSPQAMLDDMVSSLSFDPLEFANQTAKEQRATLIDIMGVDTSKIDEERQVVFNNRTLEGRDVKTLAGKLEGRTIPTGIPEEEVNIAEISDQLREREQRLASYENNESRATVIRNQIAEMQKELERIEGDMKTVDVESLRAGISGLHKQLSEADDLNRKVREAKEIKALQTEYQEKKESQDKMSARIKELDETKTKMLAEAKLPLPELSINDEGVLYNDIPFNQLSSAEQLKVSLAIAMAGNPELKVIRIMDGSLLDSDNMKVIAQMAKDKDYQVWIEKVDDTGKVGIYIEDGEVKTDNRHVRN